jgi:hypothetical protein
VVKGFSPLDEQLALTASHYTPLLVEQMVRLGNSMPFRQAASVFAAFNLSIVSYQTLRRQTERAGALAVSIAAQASGNEAGVEAEAVAELGLISVDGAMVPLRGGEWAEVRTLVVGEVRSVLDALGAATPRTSHLSYYSRLCSAKQFEAQVWPELVRRGIAQAKTVVALSDGAEWIQSLLDLNWQAAVRILDYTHAVQHLAQAGAAALGEASAAFQGWYAQQCHELKHGDGAKVVAAVAQLGSQGVVSQVLNYLSKRLAMMAYAEYQSKGYPIGSGSVESANKLVVEARLKGAGMHWARENVNPMLALRNAEANQRWNEVWGKVAPRCLAQRQRRSSVEPKPLAAVHSESHTAVVSSGGTAVSSVQVAPAPVVQAMAATKGQARPAADHPWRHMPIGKAAPRTRYSHLPHNLYHTRDEMRSAPSCVATLPVPYQRLKIHSRIPYLSYCISYSSMLE